MEKTLDKETFLKAREYAQTVVDGLASSASPFHSVQTVKDLLNDGGFTKISEADKWNLEAGGKYYYTRNKTTLVAFIVGTGCEKESPSLFKVVGCHTDSPCIRIAPKSQIDGKGFDQIAIQTYGGGQWHTWLDRELTFAGRVIVYNEETKKLEDKLWHHKDGLFCIPHMAIHLQSMDERSALKLNKETHLRPIIATQIIDQLMDPQDGVEEEVKADRDYGVGKKHLSSFLKLMAEEIDVKVENIIDFELSAIDAKPSSIFGLHKEFISSGRLDNMVSSLTSTHALIERAKTPSEGGDIDMIVLFDHEEIGSVSAHGADSTIFKEAMERVFYHFSKEKEFHEKQEAYLCAIR